MLALIMAGGEGSRLNLGEKPLVQVGGQPMIAHVIDAFRSFGSDVVVVASRKTPMTQNWCRVTGTDLFCAGGRGYIEDMVSAVSDLHETGPLFISVSDIPCLNPQIIALVDAEYRKSGKDACSTWVPLSLIRSPRDTDYIEKVNGVPACPAGVNILRGGLIGQPQEELRLLLQEPRLGHNVNTRSDLAYVNSFFRKKVP